MNFDKLVTPKAPDNVVNKEHPNELVFKKMVQDFLGEYTQTPGVLQESLVQAYADKLQITTEEFLEAVRSIRQQEQGENQYEQFQQQQDIQEAFVKKPVSFAQSIIDGIGGINTGK